MEGCEDEFGGVHALGYVFEEAGFPGGGPGDLGAGGGGHGAEVVLEAGQCSGRYGDGVFCDVARY